MPRQLSSKTTLETLKAEAKRWLKALRANEAEARARFQRAFPHGAAVPTLREVQHALALEFGLRGWSAFRDRLVPEPPLQRYEAVAGALVTAYRTGDQDAMWIVWDYFGHMRAWAGMRRYVRLDLGKTEEAQDPNDDTITLEEARYLVARAQGFDSWSALAQFAASVPAGKRTIAAKAIAAYSLDESGVTHTVARSHDWDEIFEMIRERRLPGLHASGQMTDGLLGRLSRLDHITHLDLDGSRGLTDDGLRHLVRLSRLRHLDCRIARSRMPVSTCSGICRNWRRSSSPGLERQIPVPPTFPLEGAPRRLQRAEITFDSCAGLTNAGIATLARLPRLRTLRVGSMPRVTADVVAAFGSGVDVKYSV